MSTILLRLEGPMQSWGIGSRFTDRHTEAEPTKSGVIGILCSALGRKREEPIEDLTSIKMAVRVDREGQILYDYHTTLNVLRANASGKITESKLGTVVSRRFYLTDACFVVGLESKDTKLLKDLILSLKTPKWPLFLGRKSFLVSSPICLNDAVINEHVPKILKQYPWQGREFEECPELVRLIYECPPEEGEPRFDVPISFASRKFRSRTVKTEFILSKLISQEG